MTRSVFEALTVLVVDDSKHMRLLLSELLRTLGVGRIVVAGDGDEAWSHFLKHQPDVVITDAAMQPTDGFALTRRLREADSRDHGRIPIIMVSAHSELSAVEKARDVGVNEFICKPLSPRLLYERLIAVINRPREFVGNAALAGADPRRDGMTFDGAATSNSVAFL
ncbi:MAG: response regulator [Parvibaculum sp.]|uniref:response regulator n=1 Tax=Parvibaculum sp. TaxID=2024848 RepID=UPI0025CEE5F6|nr:response regulator [Parvibaculum sp.]MCE9648272.1 response regulator [Parvibaculum sp.]